MLLAVIFDSVGFGEWFVLLAVVLIVVGPKRLPATARNLGKWYNKIRRTADEFKRQLMEMDTGDGQTLADTVNEVKNSINAEASDFDKTVSEVDEAFRVDGDEATAEPNPDYGPDEDGVYRNYYDAYNGDDVAEGGDPAQDAAPEPAADEKPSAEPPPSEPPKPAKRNLEAIKIVVSELPKGKGRG